MDSLENTLQKVESLKRNLSAERVVREEKGHYELSGHYPGHWTNVDPFPDPNRGDEWVIDQPRITEPDTTKRETARAELFRLYDSSEWYSARYITGKSLGINEGELRRNLFLWLYELDEELRSVSKETRKVLRERDIDIEDYMAHHSGLTPGSMTEETEESFKFVNQEKRIKAVRDLGNLFSASGNIVIKSFLEGIYRASYSFLVREDECEEIDKEGKKIRTQYTYKVKKEAGKALGYSRPRIWLHI